MPPHGGPSEALLLTRDPAFFALWPAALSSSCALRISLCDVAATRVDAEVLGAAPLVLIDLGDARPSGALPPLVARLSACADRTFVGVAHKHFYDDPEERAACRANAFFWVPREQKPTQLAPTLEVLFTHHCARQSSDRRLLEATQGSVEAMVAALASLSPEAHGHAVRVAALAEALAFSLGVRSLWTVRLTGLCYNLGVIALEHDTLHRALTGTLLTPAERLHVDQVPRMTLRLLDPIPHIAPIKAMLGQLFARGPERDAAQAQSLKREAACAATSDAERDLDVGAQAVGLAKDYDAMLSRGIAHEEALRLARLNPGAYATVLVTTLETHIEAESTKRHLATVALENVPLFATLLDDVRMPNGTLLVSRGHVVDVWLKERLSQLAEHTPGHPINVALPL